jgi:hypothetical protein
MSTVDELARALEWAIRNTIPVGIYPSLHVRLDPRVPVGTVEILIVMHGTEESFAPLPPALASPCQPYVCPHCHEREGTPHNRGYPACQSGPVFVERP